MKHISILIFFVLTVAATATLDLENEWTNFKLKFNKTYDEAEENRRKEIFANNLKIIEDHNKLYEKGESTYKMGVNQFTDLTPQEFHDIYASGLKVPDKGEEGEDKE